MQAPLVSIKMITYNHAPFIAQAIEGVLQQKTNFPFELIIGEDCSTDGTREIVLEYQKKYPDIIRMVTSDKNVGMKKNSLRTMKACQGKYIAYCEGDDYWQRPDKLQKQADYLDNHPECGLVYSSYDVYHVASGEKISDFIKYRKIKMVVNPNISDIVDGKNNPQTCTVMARRNLCEQIIESDAYLHKSENFLMGDTQLWAEMATKARLYCIPESLATYNITEESATRSSDVTKTIRFSISNAKLMLYLCYKYNLPQPMVYKYEKYYEICSLKLAFHTRNTKFVDEMRRKNKTFTCEEWLLYWGAKNSMIYYPVQLAAVFRNLFRKKHDQWS